MRVREYILIATSEVRRTAVWAPNRIIPHAWCLGGTKTYLRRTTTYVCTCVQCTQAQARCLMMIMLFDCIANCILSFDHFQLCVPHRRKHNDYWKFLSLIVGYVVELSGCPHDHSRHQYLRPRHCFQAAVFSRVIIHVSEFILSPSASK